MRPTTAMLDTVAARDFGRCAWCGEEVFGRRGEDFSLHHRRPAGMGGDKRPETHAAGNLILLHGSGCTRCHGVVESARALAFDRGFLIPKGAAQPPSKFAIQHAVHGLCYLLDDGSWSTVEALVAEEADDNDYDREYLRYRREQDADGGAA